jgi:hypothetical protein
MDARIIRSGLHISGNNIILVKKLAEPHKVITNFSLSLKFRS